MKRLIAVFMAALLIVSLAVPVLAENEDRVIQVCLDLLTEENCKFIAEKVTEAVSSDRDILPIRNLKKAIKDKKKNKKGAEAEGIDEAEASEETFESEAGVEDLMPVEEPQEEKVPDVFDDFEDFDDQELSGLDEIENLDEILDREGIYISEGDTVGNVIAMYNTGFSIIEISKVLKIEVGEVKSIIDMHQGD